ncbi:unnamed protein product [Spirodela intermedia]|uniref:F-box protein n=1 Tax=Spirodela intermedia TaxID=51605 RepID=A0A7I8KJN3_SPIIN|nr:unnamed protein product [Spirodela intermedia]
MGSLRMQNLAVLPSSSSSAAPQRSGIRPRLPNITKPKNQSLSVQKLPMRIPVEEFMFLQLTNPPIGHAEQAEQASTSCAGEGDHGNTAKLYAIMEAAADRAAMHDAIGVQRDGWNTLLLNSLNSMTLAASIAAGLSAMEPHQGALKVSSAILYSAATAISLVVNKIQPSQLAEEQRNAARLFRQLEKKIRTAIAVGGSTVADVEDALERVLALDKAYPLSLLPGMLEKFPQKVEPAAWWPERRQPSRNRLSTGKKNGWSEGLEYAMNGVLRTLKKNDTAEYVKLGELVLGINSVLAISGPLLTGLAAVGASMMGPGVSGTWPVLVAVVGGALATVVNSFEHGGQVGMVFEMSRNSAGFYREIEEEIQVNLGEEEEDKREYGELFELKTALKLGRSPAELRRLASHCCTRESEISEYAGRLF